MATIGFLYRRLDRRFAVWPLLTILTVAFESLSIGLLLPLISRPESDSVIGNLVYFLFAAVGVEYSLVSALAFVAVAYTARSLMFTLQGLVAARSVSNLLAEAKLWAVDHIGRMDYGRFSRTDAGVLNNAVTLEFNNMAQALAHINNALAYWLLSIGMFLLAFLIEPQLLLVALAISVPCYFGLKRVAGFLRGLSTDNTFNNGVIQALMTQMLAAFKYLKATDANDRIAGKIQGNIRTQAHLLQVQRSIAPLLTNAIDLALVFSLLGFLIFYTGGMGNSLVEAVFVLVIIRRGVLYTVRGQAMYQMFLEFSGSVRIFQELHRDLPEHGEPAGSNAVQPDFSQPISFRNVSFGYSGSGEVLNDLDLTIPPGGKVAIVGSSGSGKSTLVTMLTGLLRPTSGVITLGDTPYGEIDQAALRSRIGYVTQETVIFNDSVENNVSMWDPQVEPARVRQSLCAAGGTAFVNDLPQGLSTSIGDEGAMLSGGQRQRIAIARELYKKPRLLICDEGTSALESDLEESILRNIDRIRGDASVVLVSHRLPITRDADVIYVMDRGRVVERGRYEELYATGGLFREMVDRQAHAIKGSAALVGGEKTGRDGRRKENAPETPMAGLIGRRSGNGQPEKETGDNPDSIQYRHPGSGQGACVWFTGLSGAGKSTTAEALTACLRERGCQITLLDGDAERARLSRELGFSKEDRDANVLRIGLAALEVVRAGGVAVCATISPYADTRHDVRDMVGADRFLEVYVNTPVEVCEERDPKGLYAMARRGELANLTGIDDPYEPPASPDVELETALHSAQDNAQTVLAELQARGLVG